MLKLLFSYVMIHDCNICWQIDVIKQTYDSVCSVIYVLVDFFSCMAVFAHVRHVHGKLETRISIDLTLLSHTCR